MKKVVVGSNNPVKLEATKEAFEIAFPDEVFEFLTHSALSGVPDQPFGVDETKLGATNRSDDCKKSFPEADYFVGLEGGLEEVGDEHWAFAWMCVQNSSSAYGYGRTSSYLLPPKVSKLVRGGAEFSSATDIVFNEVDSKYKGGTVSILTNGHITRKGYYREAVVFALIPFINPDLYTV
jgi:inosine/xanthosine triphosphatase